MTITEQHDAPSHYLYNTAVVDEDISIFDMTPSSSRSIDNNGRGTVYLKTLNTSVGRTDVVVKKYQRGGVIRHFNKHLYWHQHYSRSRVWLEFKLLSKMIAMNLPVPVPVAGMVRMKFPQWFESIIITQEIVQSKTLANSLQSHQSTDPSISHSLWQSVGKTIKRFHTAGIHHADLNASNILVTDNHDIYLIDFDRGRLRADRTGWKKGNLDRLQRSMAKLKKRQPDFHYSKENWDVLMAAYQE